MSPILGEATVAIGGSLALSIIVKATMVSGTALIAARLARHSRASLRHVLFATAFVVLLVLPVVAVSVPARPVAVAIAQSARTADIAAAGIALSAASVANGGNSPHVPTRPSRSTSTLVLAIWLAGVAIVLVPMHAALLRLRRLRQRGIPWRQGQAVVDEIAAAQAVRTPVQLLIGEDVVGPMTGGVIRPFLVLPRDARQWAPAALRHAIVHEWEHIRRKDWLMLCTARVGCALYWFHPFVWLCWRKLRLDAERACDDAVLGSAEPEEYADQLVTLAERLASPGTPSALAMANRSDLSARVAAVLDASRPRGRVQSHWTAIAAVAAVLLIAVIAPLRAVAVRQASAGSGGRRVAFEVASIKLNTSGSLNRGTRGSPDGSLQVTNMSVMDLIVFAYGVRESEVSGGPGWLRSSLYDIAAKPAQGATPQQIPQMVQSLLEERFQLRVRRENRDMPIYSLRVAKGGPRFVPANEGSCRTGPATSAREITRSCGYNMLSPATFDMVMAPIAKLADALSGLTGRRVVDETGLTDTYSLHLDFAPEQAEDASRPSVFTAVQEQLGLRLESSKGPVRVLVIEGAEKPKA